MSAQTFKDKQSQKLKKSLAAQNDVVQSEVVHLKTNSSSIVNGVERNTVSRASSIIPSAISSSINVDINLETQLIGSLLGNTLKLTLQNLGVNSITLPKLVQDSIKFIEIMGDNGNVQIARFDKDTLMYPLRLLDSETLKRYKRGYESDDAEMLVSGATRTYYIPLIADPFALNEVFMQGVKGGLQYKIYFDSSAWVDGYPSLTDCTIISRHMYYGDGWMESLKDKFLSEINTYNYRSYIIQNFTSVINADSSIELNLDSFKERSSEIFLQLWKNGETLVQLGNYIESYDITDKSNSSLISSGPIDSYYDEVILSAVHDYQPVISLTSDPWTVISFSPEMGNDFTSGEVNGLMHFKGNEILKLKISADLPTGVYQLRVYFGKLAQMQIVGGNIKVL